MILKEEFIFQLSLLLVAAAANAQVAYPLAAASTAPLVYAANFGYASYGIESGKPPNNPFEFRSALDVFRPSVNPVAYSGSLPYATYSPAPVLGYPTPSYYYGSSYLPTNSFVPNYFGGFRAAFASPVTVTAPVAPATPVEAPAAVEVSTAVEPVAAAIPAAAAPAPVEVAVKVGSPSSFSEEAILTICSPG